MTPKPSSPHLVTIDALRAIAALSVAWYHISGFYWTDPSLGLFASTGKYGFLGVQVFFVISGFIIPYALHRSAYRVSMLPRFAAKRILRIDPPYLVAIAIFLAYQMIASRTSQHQGAPYVISWPQVLAHFGYVNAFIGLPWLMPAFWTLAIEFQYYLTIGLLYPIIARPGFRTAIGIAAAAGIGAALLRSDAHLPHHLPLFAMGIAVFRYRNIEPAKGELAFLLGASVLLGGCFTGWPQTIAGILTALTILLVRYTNRVLSFFGDISYSLYLIHGIVAAVIIIQGRKHLGSGADANLLLMVVAMAAAIVAAWVLAKCVEEPSKRLAARIRYQTKPRVGSTQLQTSSAVSAS